MARSNDNFRSDEDLLSSSRHESSAATVHEDASGPSRAARRPMKRQSTKKGRNASPQSDQEDLSESPWNQYGYGEGQKVPTGKCFVIGIDYGATFSGVGYILVNHAEFREQTLPESLVDRVKVLCDYQDEAIYHSKYSVPTILTYSRSGSDSRPLKWGFPAWGSRQAQDRNHYKVELPKFLFSKNHNNIEVVKSLREAATKLRKKEGDFTTDFLRLLIEHLNRELEAAYPDFINAPRYYYCGVPAGWNEEKALFAETCNQAGLYGAILVSESEAAANAMLATSDRILKLNEAIIVVDAGGMTVDVQAYLVVQIHPPIVRAITSGDGLPCGSAFLNVSYQQYLLRHPKLLSLSLESRRKTVDSMVEEFEKEKKTFNIDWGKFKRVKVHSDTSRERGWAYPSNIDISYADTKWWFDTEIEKVMSLIDGQLGKCEEAGHIASRMGLTGGFSASPYYLQRMRNRYKNITIERTNAVDVNVPRGIVATALNQSRVTGDKSRFNIGIDEWEDYDEDAHEDAQVYVDAHEGHNVVGSIHWLLRKDMSIPTPQNPIRYERQRTIKIRASKSEWLFRDDIIVTKADAKDHLDRFRKGSCRRRGQEVIEELRDDCWAEKPFLIDLRRLPKETRDSLLVEDPTRPGKGFRTMNYEIALFFDHGDWIFQFTPCADRSIVLTHSYRANSYYTMQTEIGTLSTSAGQTSGPAPSNDIESDQEGTGASFVAGNGEIDADAEADDIFDIPDDEEETVADEDDDAPGLSAVQRGKRPAKRPNPHITSARASGASSSRLPPLQSLGSNRAEKAALPQQKSTRKRKQARSQSSYEEIGNPRPAKKRRKTSLSIMDPLRNSYPDDE